jgi:hypothetical protein
LWKDDSKAVNRVKAHFKNVYRSYKERDSKIRAFYILHDDNNTSRVPKTDNSEDNDMFKGFEGKTLDNILTEVESWLLGDTLPKKVKNKGVRAFWKSKGYDFRIITQMARDHMAVPATSAASERVFSSGGDIITKKRNRIGGENTRYLLCLRSWGIFEDNDDKDELEARPKGEESLPGLIQASGDGVINVD